MKICFVIRSVTIHETGGMQEHTEAICKGLVGKGNKVTVITSRCPYKRTFEQRDGIDYYYLENTRVGSYSLQFFTQAYKKYSELDTRLDFDIVHGQGFATIGFIFHESKPLVLTMYGTLFSETFLTSSVFWKLSIKKKLVNLWVRKLRIFLIPVFNLMLKRSDKIIAISEFTKRSIKKKCNSDKIEVVYPGIDLNKFAPLNKEKARGILNLPEEVNVLVTLGRISEEKGFQIAIKAVEGLKNIVLIIGGDGKFKRYLEDYVNENRIENVRFVGRIPDKMMSVYYSAADIFIYSEIVAPAFGLVGAEALACGTPVIASNSGAIPEVVTPDVGLLFETANPLDLRKKIITLLNDTVLIERFKNNARQRINANFTLNSMIENVIKVYESILS